MMTRPAGSRWPIVSLPLAGLAIALMLLAVLTQAPPTPGATQVRDADAAAPKDERAQLRRHLANKPRDGRAWAILARLEFADERYAPAAEAYARALEVAPKVALDPGVWCEYADALAMTQGGVLEGRPRELVAHALSLNGAHPMALEMAGSAAYEAREYAAAVRYWTNLLVQLPAQDTRRRDLAAAIERAQRLAATALPPRRASLEPTNAPL